MEVRLAENVNDVLVAAELHGHCRSIPAQSAGKAAPLGSARRYYREMLDDRSQAYANLRKAAESALERPEAVAERVIGRGSGLLTFSITWQPSFEPNAAFALLTRPERSGAPTRRVCRVAWDASQDFSRVEAMPLAAVRLRPPEPTLQVAVLDAPSDVGAWMEEVSAIHVPPVIARPGGGLDGSLTTVRFGDAMQFSEFRWWCDGPPEWAALVAWTARTRTRLEHLFSVS